MTLPEVPGVSVIREGAITTVILARPGQYNSISYVMWLGLRDLFAALGTDPDLRGVVLTGAGGCFSSGADIADFEQTRATPEQGVTYEVAVDEACNAIANLGCPVIAAIEGYCYGGACNLAMASDFRFVADNAKFSIPAAKLSIVYSPRGMARLVALVGLVPAAVAGAPELLVELGEPLRHGREVRLVLGIARVDRGLQGRDGARGGRSGRGELAGVAHAGDHTAAPRATDPCGCRAHPKHHPVERSR
jgi:enoyl-CoA hydratase/carnithine racemase